MKLYGVFRQVEDAVYGILICHAASDRPALFHNLVDADSWRDDMASAFPDSIFNVYMFDIDPTIRSTLVR